MPLPREPGMNQPITPQWGRDLQRHVSALKRPAFQPRTPWKPRTPAATGGAAVVQYHPWQIIKVADGGLGDPGTVQVTTGFLGSDLSAESSETITGLNSDLDVEVDYLIFLRWDTVDGWDIVAEEGVDTNWPDYPDLIAHDTSTPFAQTNYWVLIGYVGATPADTTNTPGFAITINADPYWIYQCLRTDLLEQALCYNGLPAVYPFAHPAPFV